jgi:outer membrane immunogenic protein
MSRHVLRCQRKVLALAAALTLAPIACSDASSEDWTQFYVGASAGVDALVGDVSSDLAGAGLEADGLGGGDLGLTLRLGGDYQVNSWFVIGAFAEYDWSHIDTQAAVSLGAVTMRAEILRLERAWTLGGRAGYLLSPRVLAYGLVGYTEVTFADMAMSVAGLEASFALPKGRGAVVGAGFEHRLTPVVSFTGEYRASFLDEETFGGALGTPLKAEATMHAARLGLAIRFDGSGSASAAGEQIITENAADGWTGVYAGIGFGADAIVGDVAFSSPAFGMSATTTGLGGGDIGGSATIGYDHGFAPKLIVGPFVTFDKSAQDIDLKASALGQSVTLNVPSIDYMVTAGARAGVLASDDTLVYGLVGYTYMTFTDLELISSLGSVSIKSESYSGLSFGGGVEKLIGHGLSLRAEYRFVDLGSERIANGAGLYTISAEPDLHTSRLTLTYRP